MKSFKEDIVKIYQTERGMMVLMIINLLLTIALFVFAIIKLKPDLSVIRVGYGDMDGYREGSWIDMLAYPILAIVFGILHNLLAVKIFHKRGGGMAKFFLLITTALILGTALVLARVLGEG